MPVCAGGFSIVWKHQLWAAEAAEAWKGWLLKYTDLLEWGQQEEQGDIE